MSLRLGSTVPLRSVPKAIARGPSFVRHVVLPGPRTLMERERAEVKNQENAELARHLPRQWKAGDVYAPHDLSGAEARKWRNKTRPTTDAFDALSVNPLTLYKNFSIMSEYVTEMGRIRHSKSTGLRPVNQRKIAKAVRRAIALGLMPSVHRHPEILKKEMLDKGARR